MTLLEWGHGSEAMKLKLVKTLSNIFEVVLYNHLLSISLINGDGFAVVTMATEFALKKKSLIGSSSGFQTSHLKFTFHPNNVPLLQRRLNMSAAKDNSLAPTRSQQEQVWEISTAETNKWTDIFWTHLKKAMYEQQSR